MDEEVQSEPMEPWLVISRALRARGMDQAQASAVLNEHRIETLRSLRKELVDAVDDRNPHRLRFLSALAWRWGAVAQIEVLDDRIWSYENVVAAMRRIQVRKIRTEPRD